MNRKLLNIIFVIGLFLSFYSNIFAFDAKLILDKSSYDINSDIKLRIKINSDKGGNIGITNIKGLDKFNLISQSQFQSSSTSMVLVNGKTQSQTNMSNNLDLILKAKSKGDFVIGPAILKRGNEQIQTNKVNIKITGDKLFINNNHLTIPKNTNVVNNNNVTKINPRIEKKEEINTYDNVKKREFNDNNTLYLFVGIILLTGIIGYFVIKNKPEILDKIIKKDKSKINPGVEKENSKVDFDIKVLEIVYPEVKDDNFIIKVTDILKQKIASKYKIDKIETKTFDEIIDIIGEKIDDSTKELINMLNKAKYSNIIGDNNKILEIVKEYKI